MLKSLATLAIVFVALTLAPKAEADEDVQGDPHRRPGGPPRGAGGH